MLPAVPERDGHSLWSVSLDVFSPELDLARVWMELPDHMRHRRLEDVSGWGMRDEPEGLYADAHLLVWAADAVQAEALANRLLDEVIAKAPAAVGAQAGLTRRVAVERASDEVFDTDDGPQGPEDFESTLAATPWHRSAPVGDGRLLKVAWFTGPCPLERVDVEEDADRVTITLWERMPPAFDADGTPIGIKAIGIMRCVEVPLARPLGDRRVFDGATGRQPADIKPGNYMERGARSDALALDLDTFPCQPMPSGEPVPWDQPV
jgi:hypothetical protein